MYLNNLDCLEDKRENYRECFVLYNVHSNSCMLTRAIVMCRLLTVDFNLGICVYFCGYFGLDLVCFCIFSWWFIAWLLSWSVEIAVNKIVCTVTEALVVGRWVNSDISRVWELFISDSYTVCNSSSDTDVFRQRQNSDTWHQVYCSYRWASFIQCYL